MGLDGIANVLDRRSPADVGLTLHLGLEILLHMT